MITKEDFGCLRDCDSYTREFQRRLESQGVIFWTEKTVRIPSLKLVLTKHDLGEEARKRYSQIFQGHQIRVIWYFDYSDLKECYQREGIIGGKQKKKSGAAKQKEKLEVRRRSLTKLPDTTSQTDEAGPSGTQVVDLSPIKSEPHKDSSDTDTDSEEEQLTLGLEQPGDDSDTDSSGSDPESSESDEEEDPEVVAMADPPVPAANVVVAAANVIPAGNSLEENRRALLGNDYNQVAAVEDLRRQSSMYWMADLVNKHLVGASVYRELIFKNNEYVAALSLEDKTRYLPMLINVICQSRMAAINENGRIPLQVLMIAEMTGLYQDAKTADAATSAARMNAACLAILEDPDLITCCAMQSARRLAPLVAPAAGANAEAPDNNQQGENNLIPRDDPAVLFGEVVNRIRLDVDSRPMITPLAAYTCAVTAMAKKGMVSQHCLDKIIDGVKSDLGRQIALSTELIRRYHDRFPITLTRENVARRMKAIEDIIPEENMRLKIIIRQAALSGLTCITTIKKAMDTRPDFPWARVCALFPGEAQAATEAFRVIGDNPYYGFTSTMEGVASIRYKNLAYVAKEVLIRYLGESDLKNYAGFPRTPMYPDRVAAIFDAYRADEEPAGAPAENQALLTAMREAAVPFGY